MASAPKGLNEIAEFIRKNDDFTLIAHISPDGDTLGSSLAVCSILKRLDKRVQVVCEDSVPRIYSFLPGAEEVLTPLKAKPTQSAIAVDCADPARMGTAAELFEAAAHTANIDHHITNTGYAEANLVEGDAAAVGELIYALACELLEDVDGRTASCIYTALITDTGNFAYGNTTPTTHRTAAALLETGINTYEINRLIFRTIPIGKTKLLGIAITNMRLLCDGKLGISCVNYQDMHSAGASDEDTEGIIDHIRDVDTVELAMLIRECGENTYKVSLRSKQYADVSAIAGRLGGGGHKRAAGYTAYGTLESVLGQAAELGQMALDAGVEVK